MRWVAAGVVAAAALLGLLVLVAMVVYVLQPPGWLQMVLGIAMTAGACFFAWLLASALRKDDRDPRRR
jgi:threonine/homoserine/homoserine lactone efflux protein